MRTSVLQDLGAGVSGGAGGVDIVHQQDAFLGNQSGILYAECAFHITAALRAAQSRLCFCSFCLAECTGQGNPRTCTQLLRQQIRLIESTGQSLLPMQGSWNDQVESNLGRQSCSQKASQGPTQLLHAIEFEEMNEGAQAAFVSAYTIKRVEGGQPIPAKPAAASVVQCGLRTKRSMTLHAKCFGAKRFWKGKTGRANRKAGKFLQAGAANAAIVGKRKRKRARGGMCGYFVSRR